MSLDDVTLRQHARLVAKRMAEAKVIPFLGAGANLCDRPPGVDWRKDHYLPSGSELSDHLADSYGYPPGRERELVRVAQYVDLVMGGDGALFDELRPVFTGSYEPSRLHRYLAELPAHHRAVGVDAPYQLIVTTNYDDMLERAFHDAQEEFDVVYYSAERDAPGRFIHLRADGTRKPIPKHTDYRGLDLTQRTIILKIHGDVDPGDDSEDSYVITEDHYIDYLAHGNLSKLVPAYAMARMRNSHFLFLGYGMRDWNLRVILHHIWSQQVRRFGSWAIERQPDPIDERFWERHRVDIVKARLEDWVDAMLAAR